MAGVYADLRGIVSAYQEWLAPSLHDGHAGVAPYDRAQMDSPALGFLHITRVPGPVDPVTAEYQIVFAPLGGQLRNRHALRHGLDGLTDFLRQAGVPLPEIERAWQNLAKRRIYSVPGVALTQAQIEALGL